jgi:hypothetical protein
MVAQGPGEAVANANSYSSYDVGMCLKWVRGPDWEVGSLYGDAIDAWYGARYKHPGDRNPPKGAPCFYSGGPHGHIVIAKEEGMRSTDCPSSGRVGDADLNWPEVNWGDSYLGWTEDLNGVRLPGLIPTPTPEEPVATFINVKAKQGASIPPDNWTRFSLVDDGDDPEVHGSMIQPDGAYSFVLNATVDVPDGSTATIRTRLVSLEKKGDSWEQVTAFPPVEHPVTSGGTYIQDSRIGKPGSGRRVAFDIYLTDGGTVTGGELSVLLF